MWTEIRARDRILEYGKELSRSINDRGFLTNQVHISFSRTATIHGTSLFPIFPTLSGDNTSREVEIS